MIHKGVATFTLDSGKCPRWLFDRMVKLGRDMVNIIVAELGPDEFIFRIADPVWFQSLGTVLAFDWNASGLTTILTAALKTAIRGQETDLGIFICGGKGKTSRKTPEEIISWGKRLSLANSHVENFVYNSRMTAKVDSSLIQDGFQIYHHSFFFSKRGSWSVIQQGMNTDVRTARRYHWYSQNVKDLVCEPHIGISSQTVFPSVLNLTSSKSTKTRSISSELVGQNFSSLMKDIVLLRKYSTPYSNMARLKTSQGQTTMLNLKNTEFKIHPVINEDFSKSKYLEKILWKLCDEKPKNYERLLATKGVGPKTVRALSLVSEVIYGATPSYEDPARYSFAHGGKDATPYPVDRDTYDESIEFFKKITKRLHIPFSEKRSIEATLEGRRG